MINTFKERLMPTAMITTILRQEIQVPEGATREDVLDFLGEYQSFRGAFQGVDSLDGQYRILDLVVVEEEITELGEEAYDD
jgi:hypothetical protein